MEKLLQEADGRKFSKRERLIDWIMKEAYHIFSDGSCDLPMELTKEKNITVVPFYVSFDGEKYEKEMVRDRCQEFYQRMVDDQRYIPNPLFLPCRIILMLLCPWWSRERQSSVSVSQPSSVAPTSQP